MKTITVDGTLCNARPATILSARLGEAKHPGRIVLELEIRFLDDTRSTGEIFLDTAPMPGTASEGTAFGMDCIIHVLRAAKAASWLGLYGAKITALQPATGNRQPAKGRSLRVLGLAGADAFLFQELADDWTARTL